MRQLADPRTTATQAREVFLQSVVNDLPAAVQAVDDRLRLLCGVNASPQLAVQRRECWSAVQRHRSEWMVALLSALQRLHARLPATSELTASGVSSSLGDLSLVDDDTMERELLASRLALSITDQAASEFTDLRLRLNHLEQCEELSANDLLRPHMLARLLLDTWRAAGLGIEAWRTAKTVLHDEFGHLVARGYHDTNRWLIEQGVLPEIDLRPLIRRVPDSAASAATELVPLAEARVEAAVRGAPDTVSSVSSQRGPATAYQPTRLMTRHAGLRAPPAPDEGQTVIGALSRLVDEQVPGFGSPTRRGAPTALLADAMADVERQVAQQLRSVSPGHAGGEAGAATVTALLDGISETRQVLKSATESPIERATIEIVALLFQNILMEDRLPASVRVWFARLQMPVLRVAISEPDFFAGPDHPARKLIDRMGACAMGFDAGTAGAMGPAMEAEIKRVVQVVEAYPDTGRRVFQTVLDEFEKFLEDYFRNENAVSRVGVSLAQQVEQRETLSIQYMIELRKMLDEVPVQEGVRDFLFQVWADVLATTAVKTGRLSDSTRQMKRAAADLIWAAGAKVTREERAEVIRRLPPLLKTLREGMGNVGLAPEQQDRHIQQLNNSLAAAFTAKTAAIPGERLEELMLRLETLEELLPGGGGDIEIDEAMVRDLSSHQSAELEVVGEGGSMPSPEMMDWARGIQVGHWFKLDYRGRNEPVQLAWQGLRKQLSLFASPSGRCVLFQQHRLASFLQAGLLVPAEDEALTVKATRVALAKLDADPSRLLS